MDIGEIRRVTILEPLEEPVPERSPERRTEEAEPVEPERESVPA